MSNPNYLNKNLNNHIYKIILDNNKKIGNYKSNNPEKAILKVFNNKNFDYKKYKKIHVLDYTTNIIYGPYYTNKYFKLYQKGGYIRVPTIYKIMINLIGRDKLGRNSFGYTKLDFIKKNFYNKYKYNDLIKLFVDFHNELNTKFNFGLEVININSINTINGNNKKKNDGVINSNNIIIKENIEENKIIKYFNDIINYFKQNLDINNRKRRKGYITSTNLSRYNKIINPLFDKIKENINEQNKYNNEIQKSNTNKSNIDNLIKNKNYLKLAENYDKSKKINVFLKKYIDNVIKKNIKNFNNSKNDTYIKNFKSLNEKHELLKLIIFLDYKVYDNYTINLINDLLNNIYNTYNKNNNKNKNSLFLYNNKNHIKNIINTIQKYYSEYITNKNYLKVIDDIINLENNPNNFIKFLNKIDLETFNRIFNNFNNDMKLNIIKYIHENKFEKYYLIIYYNLLHENVTHNDYKKKYFDLLKNNKNNKNNENDDDLLFNNFKSFLDNLMKQQNLNNDLTNYLNDLGYERNIIINYCEELFRSIIYIKKYINIFIDDDIKRIINSKIGCILQSIFRINNDLYYDLNNIKSNKSIIINKSFYEYKKDNFIKVNDKYQPNDEIRVYNFGEYELYYVLFNIYYQDINNFSDFYIKADFDKISLENIVRFCKNKNNKSIINLCGNNKNNKNNKNIQDNLEKEYKKQFQELFESFKDKNEFEKNIISFSGINNHNKTSNVIPIFINILFSYIFINLNVNGINKNKLKGILS